MSRSEREGLIQIRAQAKLVARLRERTAEENRIGLRSIRMDAAPRSGAHAAGLDAGMIRREEMARILAREEALLRRMEKKARQEMEGMRPELYAFCALYYIAGMSLADVSAAIDRSERQCIRYRREIEWTQADNGNV